MNPNSSKLDLSTDQNRYSDGESDKDNQDSKKTEFEFEFIEDNDVTRELTHQRNKLCFPLRRVGEDQNSEGCQLQTQRDVLLHRGHDLRDRVGLRKDSASAGPQGSYRAKVFS